MTVVISLEERRAAQRAAEPPASARCACGSSWFTLDGRSAAPGLDLPGGAITLDERGRVTGYLGTPTCVDCGTPWRGQP